MGRYIETFREQGWEYVNSTFNGWHYFRKLYDPALPEEAYEIFSDRESLHELNSRWAEFEVRYPDFYYLDLEIEASAPLTFEIVNEAGQAVYSRSDVSFREDNIRLKLPKGQYSFSMSCTSGFRLSCSMD